MTANSPSNGLGVARGAALYGGAVLGPGVLLLPALAAQAAGPASLLAWVGLLIVSLALAATFAALGVLPILFLAQIAFMVAFGVLLDTFLVRSLLVPGIVIDLGRRTWWPGALSRPPRTPSTRPEPAVAGNRRDAAAERSAVASG